MEAEVGLPVDLYIYDLTQGMARMFSSVFLGRQIEGVWHTAIVAYGREYFYGGGGITSCPPGGTQLGAPLKVERLGDTYISYQVFKEYIHGLSTSTYQGSAYNLFEHNCNNFSNELGTFLCGKGVPKYILDLPNQVLTPALRQSLQALLDNLVPGGGQTVNGIRQERQESPDFLQLNSQIEEARLQSLALDERRSTLSEKIARKERKKEKKKKKLLREQQRLGVTDSDSSGLSNSGLSNSDMAEGGETEVQLGGEVELPSQQPGLERLPSERALQAEEEDRREEEERKKNREPPICFTDLNANDAFDKLVEVLGELTLSAEEQQSLDELHQYLVLGEGSWALGDNFLGFVGRLLNDSEVPSEVRVRLLRCLATCALRDDVVLLLHQDRREHTLMNFAHRIDVLTLAEQTALALFICNLFENPSSSEWLLYISEWTLGAQQVSNIRASTKVAVHSLLSEDPALRDVGTAIVHNLACKEVFDDVSVELAMAILQHLSTKPAEEPLFRSLKALARFCQVSPQDVPQLIQMIGPPPADFKGTSERIDEQIELIAKKLR